MFKGILHIFSHSRRQVPQLTTPPVNTHALAILSSVAGDSLTKHLSKILPALMSALTLEQGTSQEDIVLEHCQTVSTWHCILDLESKIYFNRFLYMEAETRRFACRPTTLSTLYFPSCRSFCLCLTTTASTQSCRSCWKRHPTNLPPFGPRPRPSSSPTSPKQNSIIPLTCPTLFEVSSKCSPTMTTGSWVAG